LAPYLQAFPELDRMDPGNDDTLNILNVFSDSYEQSAARVK